MSGSKKHILPSQRNKTVKVSFTRDTNGKGNSYKTPKKIRNKIFSIEY